MALNSCSTERKLTFQKNRPLALVPLPLSVKYNDGNFILSKSTKIIAFSQGKETQDIAEYLSQQLKTLCGFDLEVVSSTEVKSNAIVVKISNKSGTPEAYTLSATMKNVIIDGAGGSGLFYGVQTFLQMAYPQYNDKSTITIPCTEIQDKPEFEWRGMHLDVVRHFFPVEFVKKMIDMLAMQKMNTFHWHLTDDQGWRIEIKRYPKLTSIGAWRDETLVGHLDRKPEKYDGIRYGGFYTQDQIKEVVRYAQSRYITIVPEVEMPGHAVAALSAYPEYSCTGGPFKVYTKWGITEDAYCAGKEGTFEFMENVLSEVAGLFPGKYIHVGGDECLKNRWKACPDCQKRMQDENLANETELQSYFIKRIETFLYSKDKKLIGWDEILEGGLPTRATVMSWRGYQGGIEAARSGHNVVMTPTSHCYFDFYQSQDRSKEPLSIGNFLPLDRVYSFNPVPADLSDNEATHILGAQANVWTEYMTTEKQVEYMVFPRLCAMAEVVWTPRNQQKFSDFLTRLEKHVKRLEKYGVNYRELKN